jgi:hypothetical protein
MSRATRIVWYVRIGRWLWPKLKNDRLFLVFAVLLALGLIAFGIHRASGQEPGCAAYEPPLGTVYVTRNLDERLNSSAGYWNHTAIYVGDGAVVEAQVGIGVLRAPLSEFLARPYQVLLFLPRDPAVGQRAAAYAATLVGQPYGPYQSLGPQRVRSWLSWLLWRPQPQNCVSVCRRAYEAATGYALLGWTIPDSTWSQGAVLIGPYCLAPVQQLPAVPPQPMEATP